MPLTTFRLALIQMKVVGGNKPANLQRAYELIAEAAVNGADIALLPECFDVGWLHDSTSKQAESIPDGATCQQLMTIAQEHCIDLCAGITERVGDLIYNAAAYIDKSGKLLGSHRKINELEIGRVCYAQGHRLNVIPTAYGNIGLMICADGFAKDQSLSRALCEMGADVILSPCAWAMPAEHDNEAEPYGDLWRENYIPVAKAYSVWIAGASNVGAIISGPWNGRNGIGCSLVIGPNGEEVLQGPYGVDAETILYVDVG